MSHRHPLAPLQGLRTWTSLTKSGRQGFGNTQVSLLIRQTAAEQWRLLAMNMACNLVLASSEGLTFMVIFQAATLLNGEQVTPFIGWPGPLGAVGQALAALSRGQQFALLLLTAVLLQFLMSLARYGNGLSIGWFAARCQGRILPILHRYLLSLSYGCASRYRVGHLINVAARASTTVQIQIMESELVLTNLLLAAVYMASLLLLSPWLATVAVIMAVLIAIIQRNLRPRISVVAHRQVEVSRQMSIRMTEDLQLLRLLHSSAALSHSEERIKRGASEVEHHMVQLAWLTSLLEPVGDLMPVIAAAVIGGLSWLLFRGDGRLLVPNLITFVLIIQRLNLRLGRAGMSLNRLAENSAAIQEVEEILDPADKEFRRRGGIPFDGLHDRIEIESVSLRYPGRQREALHDLSMQLRRGTKIGLVGESGSGKSSLVDLLVGLYTPTSGMIRVDGRDLASLDLDDWQRRLGVVSQDVMLINGTIAANIAFGIPEATAEDIVAAASLADADVFIRTLPEQYETLVGERGFRLSGGQRQRISLARALLRQPQLLILDEATSALDSLSEARILDTIDQVTTTMTVVTVAHRLSSVSHADEIVVLDKGRIQERGSHEALMRRGGLYASLWRRQAAHSVS